MQKRKDTEIFKKRNISGGNPHTEVFSNLTVIINCLHLYFYESYALFNVKIAILYSEF